jgi:hypothetical protein
VSSVSEGERSAFGTSSGGQKFAPYGWDSSPIRSYQGVSLLAPRGERRGKIFPQGAKNWPKNYIRDVKTYIPYTGLPTQMTFSVSICCQDTYDCSSVGLKHFLWPYRVNNFTEYK